MRHAIVLLTFASLWLGAATARAQASKPELQVPQVRQAPQIDGTFNDPTWSSSAVSDAFNVLGDGKPLVTTRLLVSQDANNLYIAVEAFEEPDRIASLAAAATTHDAEELWADDDIELFIDPSGQGKSYYQFMVNSKSVSSDIYNPRPRDPDARWNPKYQLSVKVGQKSWIAQWALPWTIFNATPTSSNRWGFNVYRHHAKPEQLITWAPITGGDLHAPQQFGALTGMKHTWTDRAVTFKSQGKNPTPWNEAPEETVVMFDFEGPADAANWSDVQLSDSKAQEPPVKIELASDNATSGKQALKLTFAAGHFPAVGTDKIPSTDWSRFKSFRADVTASAPGLLVFRTLGKDDKDKPVNNDKIVRLQPGKNAVVDNLRDVNQKSVTIVGFQIFAYNPAEGASVTVDNIRLSTYPATTTSAFRQQVPLGPDAKQESLAPAYPVVPNKIKVLGTDLEINNPTDLATRLKDKWVAPNDRTAAQIEADFRARYDELKKDHPNAVLTILRRGQKGFDPRNPDSIYDGFTDAYINGHDPNYIMSGIGPRGDAATSEIFMRHRCTLYRADLSSIPSNARILAAQLVLCRAGEKPNPAKVDVWSVYKQTCFVAEFCNRPWKESEVNSYEYAKGLLWNESNGRNWTGPDPDFDPVFIAFGQSQQNLGVWDFTAPVQLWTAGRHANHGFTIYSVFPDFMDYFLAHTSEAKNLQDRPALMVAYDPAP